MAALQAMKTLIVMLLAVSCSFSVVRGFGLMGAEAARDNAPPTGGQVCALGTSC